MAKQFKYIKKMAELGFTEDTLSKGIKGLIESLRNAQAAYDSASDDKKPAIQADIDAIDGEIATAIEKYPAKLENAKKMLAGKQAKQAERAKTPAPTPVVVETAPIIEAAPAPEVPVTIAADGGQTEVAPAAEEAKEEKKGGGGLWTILGVVGVGVLAVFGWKAYQSRG